MSLIALTLAAALQVQTAEGAAERARDASLAGGDSPAAADIAGRAAAAAAILSGEELQAALDVYALLDDREAACRQARMIQRWAEDGAQRLGSETAPGFDQFALIHLWAGTTVTRSCGPIRREAD